MNTPRSKISVALCTYNGAAYLCEQLESIANQTRLPDELIVCDDRSSDATIEIVEAFKRTSPFDVSLSINERNLGSTRNFEKAISLCRGEIIFLSDQDDVWRPDKIERMMRIFDSRPGTGFVFSDATVVDRDRQPVGTRLWDVAFPIEMRRDALKNGMFDVLLWQNVVTGATSAFRSNLRVRFLPIPDDIPNLIHDGWIAQIASCVSDVEFVDEPLIEYRQHRGQQIGICLPDDAKKVDRTLAYESSIELLEREKLRLARMASFFAENPEVSGRVPRVPVDELIARKDDPLQHYKVRLALSSRRGERVRPVIKELLTGRYHRFSKGLRSAARDLMESR